MNSTPNNSPGNDDLDQEAERLMLGALRKRFAGYTLERTLDSGGQGRVFEALAHDQTRVAIKVLHMGAFADARARARFRREVAALKVLRHAGIVSIIAEGETEDGSPFLVMPYIDGLPLDRFVSESLAAHDYHSRLRLFVRVCEAVDAAHRAGIVHRDLSPSNILVDAQGQPHVIDFGLAKSAYDSLAEPSLAVTQADQFLGKIDYAAPEQLDGSAEVTQAADAYSLGVILYGLLSGNRLPYNHGGGRESLRRRILSEPPEPLPVPLSSVTLDWEAIERIVQTALQKDPSRRYRDAGELGRAVKAQILSTPHSDRRVQSTSNGETVNITSAESRAKALQWAASIRSLVASRDDRVGMEQIDAAVKAFRDDRYTLSVIGRAKRGKSTLINALLGRRDDLVAPIDKLPASSAITRIGYATKEAAEVIFKDERRLSVPLASIREYVTEENNPENVKGVAFVRVGGPFPRLDHDLEIVDTPGAGSIHEHHDALLHGFIPESDAVIFMISARMPLDESEIELLKQIKAADVGKVFFVLNRVDEATRQDIHDALTHNQKLLGSIGLHANTIHCISAKKAYQGDFQGSGIASLCDDLRQHLAMNKTRVLVERFASAVHAAAEPARSGLDAAVASAERTAEQLGKDLEQLHERRTTIAADRKHGEKQFLTGWNAAVGEFADGLNDARDNVLQAAAKRVSETSVLGVGALTRSLPTFITKEIEKHVTPLASAFERSVAESCGRLMKDYPTVNIASPQTAIKAQRGGGMALTAIGGAASIAAGFGIVSAGASAVIAPTIVTVAAPAATALGEIGSFLGGIFGMSSTGASIGTGLGTATATIPGATPAWVALAGPIGWTLAGIGAIAIPLAWRASKARQRDRIGEATEQEITRLFRRLETERIPALRRMAESIVAELSLRLDREFDQVESAISQTIRQRPTEQQLRALHDQAARFACLMDTHPHANTGGEGPGIGGEA